MAISISNLASDLSYAIADLPTALTISGLVSGAAVNCIATDLGEAENLGLAGFTQECSISFYVPVAAFTTRPAKGQTCSAGGVTYRIKKVTTSPDDVCLQLDCSEDET